MLTLNVTPAQYATLKTAIAAAKGCSVLEGKPNEDVLSGVINTPDVSLDYGYSTSTGTLELTVIARHSFAADLASTAKIESKIKDKFNKFIEGTNE